jgi:putative transposase
MRRPGRPTVPIVLTQGQEKQLEAMARSRSVPHSQVIRARIVLMAAKGMTNTQIAPEVGLSIGMVGIWRRRFLTQGVKGLQDEPRPGRPRSVSDQRIVEVIQKTLSSKPKGATHWSCRSMAAATSLSKDTINRIWQAFNLKPHRQKHFALSTDPLFVDKVRDVVGLYLYPPDNALVLSVDEKSQIQALGRTQPILPLGLGYLEGVTHNYIRHGTTTLFAALDVATGAVLTQCKPRHRQQEFLQFLKHIDANVSAELDIHLIVDNDGTHKSQRVREWLARRPRYHVHYTPTYTSWLNQVETWFGIIEQKTIRRGTFRSVTELVAQIACFVKEYNANCKPFAWHATADSILGKVARLCTTISETGH